MMEYILSSMKVHLASVYEKILSSMKVNSSGMKVSLSGSKVNLSGGEVSLSGSKVNLSKILILKSIVCCVCVMLSSDVSWGSMNDDEDEINRQNMIKNKLDRMNKEFKVVLLGDNNVGKTQIINKKIKNAFDGTYRETIYGTYDTLKVRILKEDPTQDIKLCMWDTGGRESLKICLKFYLKGDDAVVFVYDITNKKSFENIQTWIQLAQKHADKEAVYFLVGNKADMENERQVTTEEAQKFAGDNNMTSFEVSAKDGTNINKLFEAIAKACFEKDIQIPTDSKNKRCNCCPCCNKDEDDKKRRNKISRNTIQSTNR